ncbi:sulfur carrier protein ThiS [Agaribacterium sp. ZY112]|uniref:sulfur carrier protein ThiS n=1 Tax=Agaribacterium sp. ZY112 TaxID=3233574 RepID=UPI00352615EC
MNIILNDQQQELSSSALSELISTAVTGDAPFAIAINEQFIPRSEYNNTELKDGDRVEILSPMQGG